MTQQRAIKTRAAVLDGAGTEFAQQGYVGASVNRCRILESCGSIAEPSTFEMAAATHAVNGSGGGATPNTICLSPLYL